jgi:ankyrin repeat protein
MCLFRLILIRFEKSIINREINVFNQMKKIFFFITLLVSGSVYAQKNTLLDQTFWQSKPDLAKVKTEVEKGNNPSQLNQGSFDPVVLAINSDAPNDVITYLLEQPGNVPNKLTHDSRNYLHWAASKGNLEIISLLLSKGAKIDAQDSHGASPVNFAASGQSNTKVYDLLLNAGANFKTDLTHDGANALLLAVANDKDLKLTDYFISKGVDIKSVDKNGNNLFSYATRGGNIEILKALQKRGVQATDGAFLMASQGGRRKSNGLEMYQFLESIKLNPAIIGTNGETALHNVAGKPNQLEIVNYFLSKGLDVNKVDNEGNTAFINAAATNNDIATLEALLAKVKDINAVNKKGASALALAVKGNNAEVLSFLISKGGDINVVDKAGENLAAYLLQAYGGRNSAEFDNKFKVLKDKGFDFTKAQKNGNTIYHLAVAKNDVDLLKKIEDLKVDVNTKNAEGMTALHKSALVSKDDSVLKYLLSIGAKKDAATSFKETAFDLASENETLTKRKISVDFLK